MPYKLTFVNSDSYPINIFESLMDTFFLLDILLTFLTDYVDSAGVIVYDLHSIAVNYFKTQLALDLLAGIPF